MGLPTSPPYPISMILGHLREGDRGSKNEFRSRQRACASNTHTHANWNFLVFPDTVRVLSSIMLLILSNLHGMLSQQCTAPEVPIKAAKSAKNTLEVARKDRNDD
jgi:hypothetical protein